MNLRPIGAARRAIRRVLRVLGRYGWYGAVRSLVRDAPAIAAQRPWLAFQLVLAEARAAPAAERLAIVDKALEVRRSGPLLRRKGELLLAMDELSTALSVWQELADQGSRAGAEHVSIIGGRLRELESDWLPGARPPLETLEPVSRTRILHILKNAAPERWSGFTIRTLHNLEAQAAAGLEPMVVTQIGWPRESGVVDPKPRITYKGITQYRLDRGPGYPNKSLPNDEFLNDNVEAMAKVVRQVRPAILHAHSGNRGGEHALIALALRERFGIPVVYEVRGLFEASRVGTWRRWLAPSDLGGDEPSELYNLRLDQETRICNEVDGVLAISETLADFLASRGIDRSKIGIIPNGIDPAALGDPPRDPLIRDRLGLTGKFVMGYVGNLDHPREGLNILVEALAELHRRGRADAAVLIVGDGKRRDVLEALARKLRVADHCKFTGRVPHELVSQYYRQIDLFTTPRLDEHASRFITPIKPYEAMALGLPVLVSDLGGLREIVDPPNRGAVAPPGDPIGLADAIEQLAGDPAERERIATAGRTWVRAERTWASNGARYKAAYERILGPLR